MDGFGRTIKTETGYGTTTVSTVDISFTMAACEPIGKIGAKSQPYAPGGTVYQTNYAYDGLGRSYYTTLPDTGSHIRSYFYGNQVLVYDPASNYKWFTRDAFGNLTQVQEPDPALGTVTTTYTYDILNHLTGVSMPRGSNTQTRSFNYTTGTTVGIDLLTATNPENGTVTYTYNTDHTVNTKTDAKGQLFTYTYDTYKRLYQIIISGTGRTFIYDNNTLDSSFSGSHTKGRLVAVINSQFNVPGTGPVLAVGFTEMFAYKQSGQVSGKRLRATEIMQTGPSQSLNLDAAYTYDSEGKMTSVAYPTTYAWNGGALVPTAGPTYTYSFDAMDRATGLKDQNNNTAVSGVQYNAANQYLAINYFGASQTGTYNNMNQLTRLTVPGSLDVTYTFPSGSNNGQISSQTDNISGETVTYQYDSLKRLISASGSGWSDTYGYDPFGNLTSKTPTGGAPTLSQAVSATTNQIVGQTYDANGNQLSGPLGAVTYDFENRMLTAPGVQYAYDSTNKRIWRGTISSGSMTAQEVYFYGVNGEKLATYALTASGGATGYLANSTTNLAVFFRRKRIGITISGTTTAFVQNRLGSQGNNYYPYGEDRGTPLPNDQVKFATYTRDSASSLDYADQRYYANNFGRFMSPDPFAGSGGPMNPASWNRYTYVFGDPINFNDAIGLCGEPSNVTGSSSSEECNTETGTATDQPLQDDGTLVNGTSTTVTAAPDPVATEPETPGTDTNGSNNDSNQQGRSSTGPNSASSTKKTTCDGGPSSQATKILSGNVTTNIPTIPVGAAIGGLFGGPAGAAIGGVIGSLFGVGGSVSYVPSTNSWYFGPTVVFGVGLGGGSGVGGSVVSVPSTQNPNSIANGLSFSTTFQPTPFTGAAVVFSPGSGPPVVGPSFGTRLPVAVSVSYSGCIRNCGCGK